MRTDPLSTIITVSVDVLSAAIAVVVGTWWARSTEDGTPSAWWIVLYVPIVVALIAVRPGYRRRLNRKSLDDIGPIVTAVAFASMFLLSTMVLADVPGRLGPTMAKVWVCAAVLLPTGRLIRATIQRGLRRRHHLVAPILVVGNGRVASRIVERLKSAPETGLWPIGLIDHDPPSAGFELGPEPDVPYLGTPADMDETILQTGAEGIVIAFSRTHDELLTEVVRIAHRRGLRVWVVPRMFDMVGERARIDHVGGLPLLAMPLTNPRGWQFEAVKHAGDRVLAGIGLLVISPVFLALMLLVRLSSPGSIFFRQARVGRDGRVFDCLKFRSMRPSRDSDADFEPTVGHAPGGVEGVDRRTRIGRIMRATSMDELPQLLNVLKGEMSLVGPRPERPEFVELFDAQIRRYGERHRVKSGMTGWAQVNGLRGQTSIADRAEWDNYYIENWSLGLDLKILLLTIPAVFRHAE